MNAHMLVKSPELARQHEQAKARRSRLFGPSPAQARPRPVPPEQSSDGANWWEEIIDAVCDRYGVKPAELIGTSREAYLVRARQVAMYLADVLTENSLSVIGAALGRDATTVHHGARKIAALISTNPILAAEVETLRLRLTGGDAP